MHGMLVCWAALLAANDQTRHEAKHLFGKGPTSLGQFVKYPVFCSRTSVDRHKAVQQPACTIPVASLLGDD